MDTLIKSYPVTFSEKSEKAKTTSAVSTMDEAFSDLEKNRFGMAPLLLIIMACIGGIAAAFAVQESDIKLIAVATTTAFVETLVIALAPMRIIVLVAAIAFIVDVLVFIF